MKVKHVQQLPALEKVKKTNPILNIGDIGYQTGIPKQGGEISLPRKERNLCLFKAVSETRLQGAGSLIC